MILTQLAQAADLIVIPMVTSVMIDCPFGVEMVLQLGKTKSCRCLSKTKDPKAL